jgi:hypothetical protein
MSSPPVAVPAVRLLPSSRYRHPGDVIRLISAALLLARLWAEVGKLVYRLATYWLPVLPGWYSWRLLQRTDYL